MIAAGLPRAARPTGVNVSSQPGPSVGHILTGAVPRGTGGAGTVEQNARQLRLLPSRLVRLRAHSLGCVVAGSACSARRAGPVPSAGGAS